MCTKWRVFFRTALSTACSKLAGIVFLPLVVDILFQTITHPFGYRHCHIRTLAPSSTTTRPGVVVSPSSSEGRAVNPEPSGLEEGKHAGWWRPKEVRKLATCARSSSIFILFFMCHSDAEGPQT